MNNILVLGGTGFVGRSVCERLIERGQGGGRVLVPTRRLDHGREVRPLPTVELIEADVHDDAQLARLLDGVDAVVNLVAILHGNEASFQRVHIDLPRRLAAACKWAGVPRLVHVSALGVGRDAPSMYLRSKAGGEDALSGAGLELTLLRPSVIFGEHDSFMNVFAALQALFPFVPLAGIDTRFQPVWVEDVASAVVRCLDQPQSIGKIIECAGPQVFTLKELVQAAGRWSGHERPVFALPAAAGRLQAALMELLPGEPLMSRDNLLSMKVPNVASGSLPGLEFLGIRPTPLEAVASIYLGNVSGRARLERLRAGAGRG